MKTKLIFCYLFASFISFAQIPSYIPASGLQVWYPFNGNANDNSGAGHNGTVNGATLTSDRFGVPNAAYMFGVNNYISVPDDITFRPTVFTISSWVTFTSTPTDYSLILAKNIGTGTIESIDINYASSYNSWFCNISSSSSLGTFITSSESIVLGVWYNMVYQFDDANNIQKIFVNGVLTTSNSVTSSIAYDTKPWTIGMEYEYNIPSFFFNGKIDDIGMWDRLLTPAEIMTVYQSNPVGITENYQASHFCSVYPNPAYQNLVVDVDHQFIQKLDNAITLTVFSYDGKLVNSEKIKKEDFLNGNKLDIENLAKGLYLLNLSSGNYYQNLKFIKD